MRLLDTYRFPGFRPKATVHGIFGDPKARVVVLGRLRKKRPVAPADKRTEPSTTASCVVSATCLAVTRASTWRSRSGASLAGGAPP